MPKLPVLSGQQVIRVLEKFGFVQVRQRGSHVVLRRDDPQAVVGCVVPLHKEVALGTLRGILKQAKILPEDFIKQL